AAGVVAVGQDQNYPAGIREPGLDRDKTSPAAAQRHLLNSPVGCIVQHCGTERIMLAERRDQSRLAVGELRIQGALVGEADQRRAVGRPESCDEVPRRVARRVYLANAGTGRELHAAAAIENQADGERLRAASLDPEDG